eukprot:scaffold431804_cov18-Prasinocladus_malaysianus.AAC.1
MQFPCAFSQDECSKVWTTTIIVCRLPSSSILKRGNFASKSSHPCKQIGPKQVRHSLLASMVTLDQYSYECAGQGKQSITCGANA